MITHVVARCSGCRDRQSTAAEDASIDISHIGALWRVGWHCVRCGTDNWHVASGDAVVELLEHGATMGGS